MGSKSACLLFLHCSFEQEVVQNADAAIGPMERATGLVWSSSLFQSCFYCHSNDYYFSSSIYWLPSVSPSSEELSLFPSDADDSIHTAPTIPSSLFSPYFKTPFPAAAPSSSITPIPKDSTSTSVPAPAAT